MNNDLPKPISPQNAEHYTWGDACDGYFLLKRPDIHVIEECMPPGTSEQAHWHERSRQLFYVLQGELTMRFDAGDVHIPQGSAVEIEPGTIHQAKNDSGTDVRFLVVSVPPSHGDRKTAGERN
ncbi:MAG: cupin domain-containing protein [Acidobacteriaceae bacterium]